jgi:putative transposase
MLHSYVRIFIHFVWSIKNRAPFLIKEIRHTVFQHIVDYTKTKKIFINAMNIQKEHVHILVSMRGDQNIDDIVKLLKGESSHWINSENLIKPKFSWQRGYGAFSIGQSHIEVVRDYIINQEEHHRKRSYNEEVEELLKKYGYGNNEMNLPNKSQANQTSTS